MPTKTPHVFISYSHVDEAWKDRLVKHLEVLALEERFEVWDDRQIAAGDDWLPAITSAIEQARVALCLISKDFLTSKFIRGTEIPRLLERRRSGNSRIVLVIVQPCAWRRVTWLSAIQARPWGGKALASMDDAHADQALADLAEEIADFLGSRSTDSTAVEGLARGKPVSTARLPTMGETSVGYADEIAAGNRAWVDGYAPLGTIILASAAEPDAHSEIDEAFEYVAKGRPEITIDLLERIRKRRWDRLSARERYRLLANLGNAKLASQLETEAARYFIQAAEYQPSDEDARSFEALGYLLLEDLEKAQNLSIALCRDHPTVGRAHVTRIRSTPLHVSFDEILDSVPVAVQNNPEVVSALNDRAIKEGRLEDAERVLRNYPDLKTGWIVLTTALGATLLAQEHAAVRHTLGGHVPDDRDRLSEAVDLFSEALNRASEGDLDEIAFAAYTNRGLCWVYIGNFKNAQDDFREALKIRPSDERSVYGLARSMHFDGYTDEAIRIVDDYLQEHTSPTMKMLLVEFLRRREEPKDLERAETMIKSLWSELEKSAESGLLENAVGMLTDIYLKTERGDLAIRLVRELDESAVDARTKHAILGNILFMLGRTEKAVAEACVARDTLGASSDWHEVGQIALLMENLDKYAEAFELWRRIVPPKFVSPETGHLLDCAMRVGEDKFILGFCQQLRAAGKYDHRALAYEVDTLTRYSEYAVARKVLLEYLAAKPEDKIVRLKLTDLAIQQGWEDLVENDPARLPAVDELNSSEIGEAVARVFRIGPDPTQAVEYAYKLYRRFPDEAAAHRALITAVLTPGPRGLQIEKPKIVAPGTAVCYREIDGDQKRWLVVEDEENPSLSRSEYASSEGLVPAMLGKVIGDSFPLSEVSIRERTGVVIDIQDKRVYRSNELMLAWAERFPDEPFFIEHFSVKDRESPSQEDFVEIIEVMEILAEQRERMEELYTGGRLPISTLAHKNGRTVFESLKYLATNPDLQIHACGGATQDLADADRLLDDVTSALLDPTAVAMLALLEEFSILESLPFQCLVTEGTLQELRDLVRADSLSKPATGYMGVSKGRLWIHEVDEIDKASKIDRLREVVAILEDKCEVIGGSDLAEVDASLRTLLAELVGQASAEAAAAASKRQIALWTDDHVFSQLVKHTLPAPRIWTQSIFIWAARKGIVRRERRSKVTGRMLQFGYFFTSLDVMTVLDMCEMASWRPEDPHLAAVLADFGNPAWEYQTALSITAGTVARIWRQAPTEEHARAITAQLLAHLASHQDHRKIVRFLIDNVDSLLGLALTRAEVLRDALQTFLQYGVPPL